MSMRSVAARLMIFGGFFVAATSFALALPLRLSGVSFLGETTLRVAQPVPYLPAVFILGIMLMFLAAVAYELWPDRTSPRPSGYGSRR